MDAQCKEIRPHVSATSARPLQQEKMGREAPIGIPGRGSGYFRAPDPATAAHTKAICSVSQSLTLNPPHPLMTQVFGPSAHCVPTPVVHSVTTDTQ